MGDCATGEAFPTFDLSTPKAGDNDASANIPSEPPAESQTSTSTPPPHASNSVKELKALLKEKGVDYSHCVEKDELIACLHKYESDGSSSRAHTGGETSESAGTQADFDEFLTKINGFMDTLPGNIRQLEVKWSDTGCKVVKRQLQGVHALLESTREYNKRSLWLDKLKEYNDLARGFKVVRTKHQSATEDNTSS
eukprot:gene9496-11250_t